MRNIKIATAQFENKSGDKNYNLSVIDRLSKDASARGADAIAFHECSITGYTLQENFLTNRCLKYQNSSPKEKVPAFYKI